MTTPLVPAAPLFAGIISREGGEPWGPTGMTSAKWLDVPVISVPLRDLIATQDGVYLRPLIEAPVPVGGDPIPHVILWRGSMYLEDGHHRAIRAALLGETHLAVRLLAVP